MLSFDGIVSLRNEEWLWQAPFIVAVSLLAGFLGAVFNLQRKWLWRLRASRKRHALRLAEAVAVGLITVGVIFAVSLAAGTCVLVRSSNGQRSQYASTPAVRLISCCSLYCACAWLTGGPAELPRCITQRSMHTVLHMRDLNCTADGQLTTPCPPAET